MEAEISKVGSTPGLPLERGSANATQEIHLDDVLETTDTVQPSFVLELGAVYKALETRLGISLAPKVAETARATESAASEIEVVVDHAPVAQAASAPKPIADATQDIQAMDVLEAVDIASAGFPMPKSSVRAHGPTPLPSYVAPAPPANATQEIQAMDVLEAVDTLPHAPLPVVAQGPLPRVSAPRRAPQESAGSIAPVALGLAAEQRAHSDSTVKLTRHHAAPSRRRLRWIVGSVSLASVAILAAAFVGSGLRGDSPSHEVATAKLAAAANALTTPMKTETSAKPSLAPAAVTVDPKPTDNVPTVDFNSLPQATGPTHATPTFVNAAPVHGGKAAPKPAKPVGPAKGGHKAGGKKRQ